MDGFLASALAVLVGLEAILFAAFGLLVTIFASFASAANANPSNPTLPPIAVEARKQCAWIKYAVALDTVAVLIVFASNFPSSRSEIFISLAIGATLILVSVITWRISTRMN